MSKKKDKKNSKQSLEATTDHNDEKEPVVIGGYHHHKEYSFRFLPDCITELESAFTPKELCNEGQLNVTDVVLTVFCFLHEDRKTLTSVASVCRAWRFYSSFLPQWKCCSFILGKKDDQLMDAPSFVIDTWYNRALMGGHVAVTGRLAECGAKISNLTFRSLNQEKFIQIIAAEEQLSGNILSCAEATAQLNANPNAANTAYMVRCSCGQPTPHAMYGTNPYLIASGGYCCFAAKHAGHYPFFEVVVLGKSQKYKGTTANGITTNSYGSPHPGFIVRPFNKERSREYMVRSFPLTLQGNHLGELFVKAVEGENFLLYSWVLDALEKAIESYVVEEDGESHQAKKKRGAELTLPSKYLQAVIEAWSRDDFNGELSSGGSVKKCTEWPTVIVPEGNWIRCSCHNNDSVISGSNPYGPGSHICSAARHAGVPKGSLFQVLPAFPASERNGIASSALQADHGFYIKKGERKTSDELLMAAVGTISMALSPRQLGEVITGLIKREVGNSDGGSLVSPKTAQRIILALDGREFEAPVELVERLLPDILKLGSHPCLASSSSSGPTNLPKRSALPCQQFSSTVHTLKKRSLWVCKCKSTSPSPNMVYGANPYIQGSNLCLAARHSGVKLGNVFWVEPLVKQQAYVASTKNGVTTTAYASPAAGWRIIVPKGQKVTLQTAVSQLAALVTRNVSPSMRTMIIQEALKQKEPCFSCVQFVAVSGPIEGSVLPLVAAHLPVVSLQPVRNHNYHQKHSFTANEKDEEDDCADDAAAAAAKGDDDDDDGVMEDATMESDLGNFY